MEIARNGMVISGILANGVTILFIVRPYLSILLSAAMLYVLSIVLFFMASFKTKIEWKTEPQTDTISFRPPNHPIIDRSAEEPESERTETEVERIRRIDREMLEE